MKKIIINITIYFMENRVETNGKRKIKYTHEETETCLGNL